MGRQRKNQKEKLAAKKANAENMANLGKMAQKVLLKPEGEPKKKTVGHRSNVPVKLNNDRSSLEAQEVLPNEKGESQMKRFIRSRYDVSSKKKKTSFGSPSEKHDNAGPSTSGDSSNHLDVSTLTSTSEPSSKHNTIPSTSRGPMDVSKPSEICLNAANTSLETLFEGFRETHVSHNSDEVIKGLWRRIDDRDTEIKKLKEENTRLRALNMHLQESLVMNSDDRSFTERAGYPKAEWLLSVSQNSGDSDYLFVKELLFRLFPTGIGKATATGRPSNNPKGRNKDADYGEPPAQETHKLDPEKVTYIKDRLYERRRILLDPAGVAVTKSKRVNKHIANVMANNPAIRGTIPK